MAESEVAFDEIVQDGKPSAPTPPEPVINKQDRSLPTDPMGALLSLVEARGSAPFRAAELVLQMATDTAKARLAESEKLSRQALADAEATISRREKEWDTRRASFEQDLDRRAKALDEVATQRAAELDRREKSLAVLEASVRADCEQKRQAHQQALQAELTQHRDRIAAETIAHRDRMSAEVAVHRERIERELKSHHEQLAKDYETHRARIAAEADLQVKLFEHQQASLKRDLDLSAGVVQDRQQHAKNLLETVDMTAGALMKLAQNAERQAELVATLTQPQTPAAPRVSGVEVAGNVSLGIITAIKELGVAAMTANPRVAKALEGPLGVAKGLADTASQVAQKAGLEPAETLPTAAKEESTGRAEALSMPLSVLNEPAVLAALQAKYGSEGWQGATVADLVAVAKEALGKTVDGRS